MLISPPFLPPRLSGETETTWLSRAMRGGNAPGGGMFPISVAAAWHGGLHLTAPAIADTPNAYEPVRAIADGVVVYRRTPTELMSDMTHALNYHSPHNIPRWTHDGVVVIKHETEIGEGENAQVTYYSITQHLSALDAQLPAPGQRIWRKDKLGSAGSIYGEPNQIHFEVVASDDQVRRLCGRSQAHLDTSGDGRTDAVFGEVYVKLPGGTTWITDVLFPDKAHPRRNSAGEPGHNIAHTSNEALYVGLLYGQGDCTITTYKEDGTEVGRLTEDGHVEYELYSLATNRYPSCPSAGYELLRFGRVLGPDALAPAQAAHWRQVPHEGGTAWVNLNAPGLHKFSDADMPHWRGWQLVDDDTDGDVRCDSAIVLAQLRRSYAQLQAKDAAGWSRALNDVTCKNRLERLVCKFPTEWADDDAQIDQRYAWLKTLPEHERLEEDDYAEFKAFVKKLGFWSTANTRGLPVNHWHLNPREFIRHFRRCGWLKRTEMLQFLPTFTIRRAGTLDYWERVRYGNPPDDLLSRQYVFLNNMMHKFGINTPERMAGFFGNAMQESGWLSLLEEGSPSARWYWPWHGRGFFQLTHAENYMGYWRWRGRTVPDSLLAAYKAAATQADKSKSNAGLHDERFAQLTPEMIEWRRAAGDLHLPEAAASAGWYWAKLSMARYADEAHVLERVQVDAHTGGRTSPTAAHCYYRSPAFWRCSASVNLPGAINQLWSTALNGFVDRCCGYAQVLAVAGEYRFPVADNGTPLEFPELVNPRREKI